MSVLDLEAELNTSRAETAAAKLALDAERQKREAIRKSFKRMTVYGREQSIRADTAEASLAAANARAEALELERDSAILGMSGWARRAGEAEGALRASEMAGIVDGWKTRAEAAEAKQAKAVEALKLLSRRSRTVIGGLSPGQSLMPAGASHTNAFEAAINEADRVLTEIKGESQ